MTVDTVKLEWERSSEFSSLVPLTDICHSLRNFLMGCRRKGFVAVIIYLYLYCIRSGHGTKLTLAKHQMRVDDLFGKEVLEGYPPHWWLNVCTKIGM